MMMNCPIIISKYMPENSIFPVCTIRFLMVNFHENFREKKAMVFSTINGFGLTSDNDENDSWINTDQNGE